MQNLFCSKTTKQMLVKMVDAMKQRNWFLTLFALKGLKMRRFLGLDKNRSSDGYFFVSTLKHLAAVLIFLSMASYG